MIKQKRSSSLLITSVLAMLMMFFVLIQTSVNAWFSTSDQATLKFNLSLAGLDMIVYQVKNDDTKVSLGEDQDQLSIDLPDFEASRTIAPDTSYRLKLTLKNNDSGTESINIRYKITFSIATPTGYQILPATITGYTARTASQSGFVLDNDGYFRYYTAGTGTEKATYSSGTECTLMEYFQISYDDLKNYSGNTIAITLTVEQDD